jgi:hypothetical protein
LELTAGIFLAACAAAGLGLTYWSGIAFTLEERLAYGTVLGAMAVAAATFAASSIARQVTTGTVTAGFLVTVAAGVAGAAVSRTDLGHDLASARERWAAPLRAAAHPWPLAAVVLVCGAWTVHFLHQAYVYLPDGLYAGYVNIWGDWAAHLTYAGSFAYGRNFPPQFPIDPGHHLGYPFMIDFFAADLVPLGLSLTQALTATTAMLGLAFPAVLYLTAVRFTGGRLAAAIAVFVFLLSGGLGFVYLFGDLAHQGLAVLRHLPHEYTLDRDVDLQWLNPVLAYLVPQRSTLFGFSLTLIVLVTVWIATRERLGWRSYLFAGVVAGPMPAFHVHAWGTVVALSAFWALFRRRAEWTAFFAPALAIGIPILVWMWPPDNTSVCGSAPSIHGYCISVGWLAPDWGIGLFVFSFVGFWLWNTSLLAPVMLLAHSRAAWFPTSLPRWFAPVWLWFLVPNVVVLQPWIWDNTKFFVFWALLGSMLAGGVLAGMLRSGPPAAVGAVAVMVVLGLSGALDLARASDFTVSGFQFTDSGGLKVARWVRTHTPPDALFVVADEHNSPIPTLAGRRELIGYPGWLWTYGLADYVQKGADDKAILDGDAATPALVQKYGVDYVMIGPQEVPRGASKAYWDAHATLVYDDGEYLVYRVDLPGA